MLQFISDNNNTKTANRKLSPKSKMKCNYALQNVFEETCVPTVSDKYL